jgi:hypothetical protein
VYQLFRSLGRQELVVRQVPAFGASFAIAGAFYTFHSFYLECAAFLATWFVIDAAFSGVGSIVALARGDR